LDGPINGQAFVAWVQQMLAPELRRTRCTAYDKLVEAAGATLRYLPPYSPDFNPIEQVFAKLKGLLRRTAARNVEALWSSIGNLLNSFCAAECANYIRHRGYGCST